VAAHCLLALRQAAMAGAAPQSLADDLASGNEAPSWLSSLPHEALTHVLRMMPLDMRARAACVCRTWRHAAADPALFAALWLDKSSAGVLNDAELLRLCGLAGAALRELRLNSRAVCWRVSAAGVVAALRAGGCAGVQRLTLSTTSLLTQNEKRLTAVQAQQLAVACPALEHTACYVNCASADDVVTACALPGPLMLDVRGQLRAARATLQLPAQLAELTIEDCDLDAACAATLREALRTNTRLTTLYLGGNNIVDAGAAALGDALRTNATLTALNLGGNDIGDAGAVALGEALCSNATLTALGLTFNGIGAAGAASLGDALRTNATLKTLELGANGILDAGADSLGDALRTNATLTALDLNYNGISAAGEAALTEALLANTTLTTLMLNGLNISPVDDVA